MARPLPIGAALANRKHGRLSINIQNDGDLNYAPGVLWTAAHHKIPLLNIMHNNRSYHEERMYIQMFGAKFNRGIENGDIGTALASPDIDYASIAQGLWSVRGGSHYRSEAIWLRQSGAPSNG